MGPRFGISSKLPGGAHVGLRTTLYMAKFWALTECKMKIIDVSFVLVSDQRFQMFLANSLNKKQNQKYLPKRPLFHNNVHF